MPIGGLLVLAPTAPSYLSPAATSLILTLVLAGIIYNWALFFVLTVYTSKRTEARKEDVFDVEGQYYSEAINEERETAKENRGTVQVFISFVFLVLFFYIVYLIDVAIAWHRPFDPTAASGYNSTDIDSTFYFRILNVFGAPDPTNIINLAFPIAFIYAQYVIYRKRLPVFFLLLSAAVTIYIIVVDLVFQRILWTQVLVNVAVGIVFGLLGIGITRVFAYAVNISNNKVLKVRKLYIMTPDMPKIVKSFFTPQSWQGHSTNNTAEQRLAQWYASHAEL